MVVNRCDAICILRSIRERGPRRRSVLSGSKRGKRGQRTLKPALFPMTQNPFTEFAALLLQSRVGIRKRNKRIKRVGFCGKGSMRNLPAVHCFVGVKFYSGTNHSGGKSIFSDCCAMACLVLTCSSNALRRSSGAI